VSFQIILIKKNSQFTFLLLLLVIIILFPDSEF